MKTLNRRDFLRTSSAAALFAATPGLAYSQVVGGGGAFTDYRALVCVFMFGGNDSFNMLVPRSERAILCLCSVATKPRDCTAGFAARLQRRDRAP